ncbi:tRNA (adenosine(37)-N6)-threonylcarbamoyltransferase complex dimerization subunit type 1 TsaB [Colwellia sp. RSH04]|uniref:tRNA (adenosine(37)-N6)-threonylcarbamoyltransferase complex dimerization subunit type 1 TsaB n=1 Tax=Colwellia sp. RSH04 TaxID=2305464 RepID=UPI000E58FC0F|nr:tRNA (adenosine(37)-N6)-threonylcarbamoyltransferase complex dimerization subunit type 1 TsaB [Colwellia sp. RSH04]RHW74860.1 tRNA (adenosine(37)-N6)-threonylcarbamoyltransferase complex dimerization subunit type 1 TsaB [Colwellia sp. RSH04]
MNYLALDASTEACSVALKIGNTITSRYELCPQSHSLMLLPMVDELLKEAGKQLSDLDGLIFGRGPGSFTGVRIGVGVVQGLAFSAQLPVVGVSSLQAMAQIAFDKYQQPRVIATIDARMSEVYNGYYVVNEQGIMQLQGNETVLAPQKLSQHLADNSVQAAYGVGTGWDAYADELSALKENPNSPDVLFPSAEAMLTIGAFAFSQGEGVEAQDAQPSYVRDTVSWKKLPGRE